MTKDILYPLRWIHGRLHEKRSTHKEKISIRTGLRKQLKQDPDAVFLLMTPAHGNIGDQGIALAETRMLGKAGVRYIELTEARLRQMKKYGLLSIMNGRTLLFNGGGYLGTIWFAPESLLREIIQKNPDSKIIMFPNTIFYEDSDWGAAEFQKSIQIYNGHKDFLLYAREEQSYRIMKDAYQNVKLIPDVVLSLNSWQRGIQRKGCLLCLRSDCEKTRTIEEERIVRSQARRLFGDAVWDTDMVTQSNIDISQREKAVEQKFDELAGAELVITDRLHGMIFCAITGTPCIVLDSKSPKVRGCYQWIRDLPYIRFADDASQIISEFAHIPKANHSYDPSHLRHYFQELQNDILNKIGG